MLPKKLEGSVVLVTGGSRGIGQAAALAFNEAGAAVYTCARDEAGLMRTRERAEAPERLFTVALDVADRASLSHLYARIEREQGKLDVLINNAGILGPRQTIEEVELSSWREVMRINLDGVFLSSKMAIPLLRAAGSGVILQVSSSVGRTGRGTWGPYAVSKHGVEGLSETLADELKADNVVSVTVNPGGTATDMRAEAYPDEDPATLPSAAEVASTFLMLAGRLTTAQSGRRYNSRDLMDPGVGEDPHLWPHAP